MVGRFILFRPHYWHLVGSAEYEAPNYAILFGLVFLRISCVHLSQHVNRVFSHISCHHHAVFVTFLSDTRPTRNSPWWNGTVEGQNYERDEFLFGNESLGVGFVLGAY
jgi:hypothetical protein